MKKYLFIIMLVFLVGIGSAFNWSTDIYSYHSLEETSGIIVDQIGYMNGTNNGSLRGIGGKIDSAFNFTPDQNANFSPYKYTGDSNFSICLWVYPYVRETVPIISQWAAGSSTKIAIQTHSNGSMVFVLDTPSTGDTFIYSNYLYQTEEWSHICATYKGDDKNMTLYLNGSVVGTTSFSGSESLYNDGYMYLGRLRTSIAGTYKGSIDEIGIWNTTLVQENITELYHNHIGVRYNEQPTFSVLINPINDAISRRLTQSFVAHHNSTSSLVNTTYFVWYENNTLLDSTLYNISGNTNTSNHTLSNLLLNNDYKWNVYTCTGTTCNWGLSNFTLSTYITLNILDSNGNNIVNNFLMTCTEKGVSISGSTPYTTPPNTFLWENQTIDQLNCTTTDENNYHIENNSIITFQENQSEYNITLTSKILDLGFYYFNGTAASVVGYWTDEVQVQNFTDFNFTAAATSLSRNRARIQFAQNTTIARNYTQFYEYQNDWVTVPEVNLTVITKETEDLTTFYIEVVDATGRSLEDAIVRAYFVDPNIGGNYSLFGQRYTQTDGKTFFYVESGVDVLLLITRDGYNAKNVSWNSQDESFTKDSPYTISLGYDTTTTNFNTYILTQTWFEDRSQDINVFTYAPDREEIIINTNYGITNGVPNRTFSLDDYYMGNIELRSGTDFSSTGTDDITIQIWVDGSYWGAYTISYLDASTDIISEISGIDQETKGRFLWIALIVLAGVSGLLIKTSNESIGIHFLMGGGIFLGIVAYSIFGWLFYTCLLVYGLSIIRRYIAE